MLHLEELGQASFRESNSTVSWLTIIVIAKSSFPIVLGYFAAITLTVIINEAFITAKVAWDN